MAEPVSKPLLRLAFLISGGGSTLRNVLELISAGQLDCTVVGVAASRDCPGLLHAADFAVPGVVVPRSQPFDELEYSARLTAVLDDWQPQLIVMGGFLTLYRIPLQYAGRVINIHPALLPAFGGTSMYGERVHEAVLASGTRVSGCTVHFVNNSYDSGAVIAQRTVPVLDGDSPKSLAARVQSAERELLPAVLRWFAEGRVSLQEDGKVSVGGRRLRRGSGG